MLHYMAGGKFFTKQLSFAEYRLIQLASHIKEMTTFTCKYGTFNFVVMRFGLMNAPAMFQHMASELFGDRRLEKVYIYDVVIFSS